MSHAGLILSLHEVEVERVDRNDAMNHSEITMTRVDGGSFTFLGQDVGGSFISSPNRWAEFVESNSLQNNPPPSGYYFVCDLELRGERDGVLSVYLVVRENGGGLRI